MSSSCQKNGKKIKNEKKRGEKGRKILIFSIKEKPSNENGCLFNKGMV